MPPRNINGSDDESTESRDVSPRQFVGDRSLSPLLHSAPRLILQSQLRRATSIIIEKTTKENTKKAYDGKRKEFLEFCNFQFRRTAVEDGRYTVTPEKVELFMHFQAYRNKHRRLGKANRATHSFCPDEFQAVIDEYGNAGVDITDPSHGIGFSAFEQYKCSIKRLWADQYDKKINSIDNWDLIWTKPMKDMATMVKSRGKRVARSNFEEKMDYETVRYGASGQIPRIASALFKEGLNAEKRKAFSSLRNRFLFLMTTHGILRGESILKAELSDLFGVQVQRDEIDPHPLYITVLQIDTGKTNKDLKLYGRVARHKDPHLCAVGALGFYLLYRFSCTGEFEDFSCFCENKFWYDIKLLVDLQSGPKHEFKKPIQPDTYCDAIRNHCKELKIPTRHFLHIGRVLGAKESEINEDPAEELRRLGNWDPTTQEKFYSTKLPLQILRSKAGFTKANGMHYSPRVVVTPPEELVSDIFPWVEKAAEMISGMDHLITAHAYLEMMRHLRIVILQDAAVLMDDEIWSEHAVFRLPVFQKPAFATFRRELLVTISQSQNPLDASVEVVLPGVNDRLNAVVSETFATRHLFSTFASRIESKMDRLQLSLSHVFHKQANGYRNMVQDCVADIGRIVQEAAPAVSERAYTNHFGSPGGLTTVNENEGLRESSDGDMENGDAVPAATQRPIVIIPKGFTSVSQMRRFWFGEGEFLNQPVIGGIPSMNDNFLTWRKHLTKPDNQRFSRIKIVLDTLSRRSEARGESYEETLVEFDAWYKGHCNRHLSKMVTYLRQQGLYVAKTRQKRNSDSRSSD